jgi:hypothetical protein
VTRGEMVEAELGRLIEKRHDKRVLEEGERPAFEAWQESERRYFARIEEGRHRERLAYHEGQAARLSNTLGGLVAHHEAEAEKYRDQRKGAA